MVITVIPFFFVMKFKKKIKKYLNIYKRKYLNGTNHIKHLIFGDILSFFTI